MIKIFGLMCYAGFMSYEVGTSIRFSDQDLQELPRRLYAVGSHIVFVRFPESASQSLAVSA